MSWQRIPTNEDGTVADRFNLAPDWTIEILSPDQSVTRVTANILRCLDFGTAMGWLIDPKERLVLVYGPGQQPLVVDVLEQRLPVPGFAEAVDLSLGTLSRWLAVR